MSKDHISRRQFNARAAVISLLGVPVLSLSMSDPHPISADQPASAGMAKDHETALSVSREWFAGSQTALRCDVHAVKSIAETMPLEGAEVDVQLRPEEGPAIPLLTTTTN